MSVPSTPKKSIISTEVPQHLVDAFTATVDAFFANARSGSPPAQRDQAGTSAPSPDMDVEME
jgi:hypothetical protein